MNVIEVRNLNKNYKEFKALENVNLTVKKGDIYGLVGRNGAGKTTLFKVLLGLSNPNAGSISINGSKDYASLLKQRESVGFLIGQNFFSYLNAYQNIEYYRKLKGIKDKNETNRVLEIVGLKGVDKPFSKYSMGMKQRLGIANALLGNPSIVILDEPINGLDPQGIVDIRNLIKKLNEEYNMTLIVSSHILGELELVANRFGIIDKGILIKEIDKNETAEDGMQSITITTDNNEKAHEILGQRYNIASILEDNVMIVNNSPIENKDIVRTLVENGIGVNSIFSKHESLESIYFDLTGGKQ